MNASKRNGDEGRKARKMSFTAQVVLGLILGLLVGLFFGESVESIGVIGTAYVRLLQMTILPYIMVSLIHGFGGLTREQAIKVAPRLALIMLVFWVVGLTLVVAMPFAFPDRESASFFNPSILEPAIKPSMLDMFIPANPFAALASGTIPAVVLFSILFGVALMGMEHKGGLLRNLDLICKALTRVTVMVVKLTPIGVFGMTAAAAGTMDVSEFARLQVYFTTYIGGCLFLTFVAFPMLVNILTPFGYGQILKHFKEALLTAFTTGNLFVVLPFLMEQTKGLFLETEELKEGGEYADILVPVAFNFPNMGKLIALLFVLFGAWFVGAPIPIREFPGFVATGWITFFGGIDLALPFMLSLMDLPKDLFEIYAVSGAINGRFATLLACMELISITLITGAWLANPKGLRISVVKLLLRALIGVATAAMMVFGMRVALEHVVPSVEDHSKRLAAMDLPFRPEMKVFPAGTEAPDSRDRYFKLFGSKGDADTLRVGYIPENLPYSYLNAAGKLVGYDVEMVCRMAKDLGLKLEFYPVNAKNMEVMLKEKRVDLIASGISLSESQIRNLGFSEPYEELVLGAVVSKALKDELATIDPQELRKRPLKIAIIQPNPHLTSFRTALPEAKLSDIASFKAFYEAEEGKYDVLLTSMEAGSAWNMIYPEFSTVLVTEGRMRKEMVMVCSPGNAELIRYIDDWIRLQKSTGTLDRLYDYWFRGELRSTEKKPPRWCILRNVLGHDPDA